MTPKSSCCNAETYLDNNPDVDENDVFTCCQKCSRRCEVVSESSGGEASLAASSDPASSPVQIRDANDLRNLTLEQRKNLTEEVVKASNAEQRRKLDDPEIIKRVVQKANAMQREAIKDDFTDIDALLRRQNAGAAALPVKQPASSGSPQATGQSGLSTPEAAEDCHCHTSGDCEKCGCHIVDEVLKDRAEDMCHGMIYHELEDEALWHEMEEHNAIALSYWEEAKKMQKKVERYEKALEHLASWEVSPLNKAASELINEAKEALIDKGVDNELSPSPDA
jgi:hypothetical protein